VSSEQQRETRGRDARGPRGWYSRGYLPHFDVPGVVQSITFRLVDALPQHVVDEWKRELLIDRHTPANDPRMIDLRRKIDRYEDAGHGSCVLRDPRAAGIVENALLFFDGERYRLIAWCVMPNHVHVMIETFETFGLPALLYSWKSYTAKEINKLLGRRGQFWFDEFRDRFIRDERHFQTSVAYIENNPVKAGLCRMPEEWTFSSARVRELEEEHPPSSNVPDPEALPGTAGVPPAPERPAGGNEVSYPVNDSAKRAGGTPAVPGR